MREPPPSAAAAFEPAEFAALVLDALAAGQESTAGLPGTATRLVRGPHERALFALRARLPDPQRYRDASRRFLALMQLHAKDALGPLTHSGEGGRSTLLHPALLDTAAQVPLTRNGRFPPPRFLESAMARARQHYAELEWPPSTDRQTRS